MKFWKSYTIIQDAHTQLFYKAKKAVNTCLTIRNWLIGYYIAEYELKGSDRANYGDKLLKELSENLVKIGVSNCNKRQLYDYIKFYRTYPQIASTVSAQFNEKLPYFNFTSEKVPTMSAQFQVTPKALLNNISYSMFKLLLEINEDIKRNFYESECIKGNWSVRELKRQMDSLYYERLGLSLDKKQLLEITEEAAETQRKSLEIRDPYVFEFLGLTPREVMSESHLEEQLISKIEQFLLELGHGFCFEARQKRILIGGEHFFVDLVFYNRILKCHVLVELKLEKFTHENIGQLNTYVSWYKKNMMIEGDNPPVGILLCTDKNQTLAEYALAGMDNNLFVSKYLLELPKKEEIQKFIEEELKNS
ncbi:PDDEXK nuclease domain-containing protein [Legionella bozemanae]|uniref:PDDEXK nuclease domain-containing protein n=1 Tax=Legionella bozemanae TaxID=447 RepID=UPI001041A36F|nr:PDDEXK nuclease domain-containing protein [Legionella bozemanae]